MFWASDLSRARPIRSFFKWKTSQQVSFVFQTGSNQENRIPFLAEVIRAGVGERKSSRRPQRLHTESWQKAGHRERQEEVSSWNLEIQRSLRSCTQTRGGLAWTLEDSKASAHKEGMQAPEEGSHSFGARGRVPMELGLRPVRWGYYIGTIIWGPRETSGVCNPPLLPGGQFWGCCRDRKEPIIPKSVVSDLL